MKHHTARQRAILAVGSNLAPLPSSNPDARLLEHGREWERRRARYLAAQQAYDRIDALWFERREPRPDALPDSEVYQRWLATGERLDAEIGYSETKQAHKEALDAFCHTGHLIETTRARTVSGMMVKVRMARWYSDGDEQAPLVSIMRDIEELARTSPQTR